MTERKGAVTFQGNPLTLVGDEVAVKQNAPDVTLVDTEMNPVKLSSFRGKTVVLATVPSLDTSVCAAETRRFNEEAANFGDDVAVVTVSMDLPFAQKRWCGAEGITNVTVLSDYRDRELATNYGLLIDELKLLARAVLIIDREGAVRYTQLVKEVTDEPDYEAVLVALKDVV